MKKFLLLMLAVCAFAALKLQPAAHASPATPAVYDTKNAPGLACIFTGCNFAVDHSRFYTTSALGPSSSGVSWAPQAGPNDICSYMCPIIRDRIQDPAGVRSATIEIQTNMVSTIGTKTVTCWLAETTGSYPVNGVLTREATSSNPTSYTLVAGQGTTRLTFNALPVPTYSAAHGGSFAGGYATMGCQLPFSARIEGYSWTEYAGESTDW